MPDTGYTKRKGRWTREECVEAVKVWAETWGEFPAATDWNPGDSTAAAQRSAERAQAWSLRAQRFYDGEYPWTGTVWKLFGSWNNLIREAGFEPRPPRRSLLQVDSVVVGVKRLADLAEQVAKLEGDQRRAILHELASTALTMALDGIEEAEAA